MQIDVISDTICPWCYIGKRRLERALRLRPQIEFNVRWRPFQLDPAMPVEGMDRHTHLEQKFGSLEKLKPIQTALLEAGKREGIEFALEKIKRTPNTFNSHRLIRWSHSLGVQDEIVESLFKAYFVDGRDIGDVKVLASVGDAAGMDGELVEELLTSDADVEAVERESSMARKIGINGVPTFFFAGQILVNGAEDPETLVNVIDQVLAGPAAAAASA